jgi:hypothetical protein
MIQKKAEGDMSAGEDVLERYERDEQNRFVIDVAADRTEDLYDCFDKHAPYMRRDLDRELADYLFACVRELPPRAPFVIRFILAESPDEAKRARIRSSVRSFFLYDAELERGTIRRMLRKSGVLFVIGLAVMSLAVWSRQWFGESGSVAGDVFAEGLTVAAWVSLWESVAVFLIDWLPRRRNVRRYERLAAAEVRFRSAGSK